MSELIKFLKSIMKWVLIIVIFLILIICAFLLYQNHNERLVTLFALECEIYEDPLSLISERVDPVPYYYLVKKRNNS